jgi:ribonuclease HII
MNKIFLNPDKEKKFLAEGFDFVVGIDEVGRGAWAGPLYMCAYAYSKESVLLDGINDSKMLSKQSREFVYSNLMANKHFIKILDNKYIDCLGLGNAMNEGLCGLIKEVENNLGTNVLFIVDGYFKGKWGENVRFETKADSSYYSVACASIIAKVIRDNLMCNLATQYPQYHFDTNVGYGTANHREAIQKHGITEIHRNSYKPLRQF